MNTHETESFNLMMMEKVNMKPVDCWNWKAPCTFRKMPEGFDKF